MSKRAKPRTQLRADPSSSAQFFLSASDAARNAAASTSQSAPTRQPISVDTATADRRRILTETLSVPTPAPTATAVPTFDVNSAPVTVNAIPQWDSFFRIDEDGGPSSDVGLTGGDADGGEGSGYSDLPKHTWMPARDTYLDELVRREGRGDFAADECRFCPDLPERARGNASFRCFDCAPGPLCCQACLCARHALLPFHRIKRWTGETFEATSLYDAGLSVQLGHCDGSTCVNPIRARRDFCAIDINGHHNLNLSFCGCDRAARSGSFVQQLMRADLYPATQIEPNTACTFRMLEHYHLQCDQGKITMYDYYETLERLTDNTGTRKIPNRYDAFMRATEQWRHLKMLKRGGRAHDPSGVAGTRAGELVVNCPACPRPGINLPDNWETISDDMKYLYVLSVAIDACFRLKRRAVSSEEKDPILGSGWAYFVEDSGYKEMLRTHSKQNEVSH